MKKFKSCRRHFNLFFNSAAELNNNHHYTPSIFITSTTTTTTHLDYLLKKQQQQQPFHTINNKPCARASSSTSKKLSPEHYLKPESPYFTPDRIMEGQYPVMNAFKSVDTTKIQVPPYYETMKGEYSMDLEIHCKEEDLQKIRRVNQLAAEVLRFAGSLVKEGVTTEEIDEKVFEYITSRGAYPSPLRYNNFPKSLCTSINEVLVHGIPDTRPLKYSDIINLDITVYLDGFHGDTNSTYIVGADEETPERPIKEEYKTLVKVTKQALWEAIKVCGPGEPMYRIGNAIDNFLEKYNQAHGTSFKSSPDYVGHGIGRSFHGLPQVIMVKNKYGKEFIGTDIMHPGMIFTIEPVICSGSTKSKTWKSDGWTVVARDGCVSAQFEHTLRIKEESELRDFRELGCEVLTLDDHNLEDVELVKSFQKDLY
ncbi:hypothetical protein C9374_012899 [Naegleria lovaniensis]|uniref:Methionine aminopeptidase n=1 Tax=Naegleria lovaniensis TaxID=51637 RepID=A0AA88KC77_NAELO|nr:uncharacterized protein C9374_012899 [Naegleria lovaniensis]KAG2373053.1 hypothetical protein C9374_012899 [Naegleria lovaniensis]